MKTAYSFLLLPALLFGNLDKDMGEFFDKFNVASNTSSPEFLHSQMGVHFLGGGGAVRTGVYDVNPIHINLPNISSGCGGIDYALGGINVASKAEMKAALKSIASNGVGYAFLLSMETLSPVVASTMKQIQTWANQLNAININSCDIGTSLVQGMWPKSQRASSYICEHASTSNSQFTDLIEAKHGCRDDRSKRTQAIAKVRKENADVLVGNYNIAWRALSNAPFDDETKNLFMTLTGTIVVIEMPEGASRPKEIFIYPPQHKKAIELLRFGGTLEKAYKIEKGKQGIEAVKVEVDPMTIPPESSWKAKVAKILKSLQSKLLQERHQKDVSFSEEEASLLKTTNFPIGSLLSLMTQYNGQGATYSIDRYSDLIAVDRVLKFAEEVVRETMNNAEALRAAQVNGYELDEYIKQVGSVLKDLQAMNLENIQNIVAEHQVIDFLIQSDKILREKERGV